MRKLGKLGTLLAALLMSVATVAGLDSGVAKEANAAVVEKTVTIKQTKTNAASVTSGTLPSGATVTFNNTYGTKEQLTKDNSMTYTISGMTGASIKSLTMSMHSNKSSGTGRFSFYAGDTTFAEISSNTGFNQSKWYGSWTTTYVNITKTSSNTTYEIAEDEDLVLTISASANSLFCQSMTFTYAIEEGPTVSSIAVKKNPCTEYTKNQYFNPSGLEITATFSDSSTSDIEYDGNESKFTFNPTLSTPLTSSVNSIQITYAEKSTNLSITVTSTQSITSISVPEECVVAGNYDISATIEDSKSGDEIIWSSSNSNVTFVGNTMIIGDSTPVHGADGITITATLKNGDVPFNSLSQKIYIFNHAGTTADPYTVADAIFAGDKGFKSNKTVKGFIKSVTSQSNFRITDSSDGTGSVFIFYSASPASGGSYTATVGKIATASGNLTLYNGTWEFNGCTVLSCVDPTLDYITAELKASGAAKYIGDTLNLSDVKVLAYFEGASTGSEITEGFTLDDKTEVTIQADNDITVSYTNNEVTKTCQLQFTAKAEPSVSSVALNNKSDLPSSLIETCSKQLAVTVSPSNAPQGVTWSSSNSDYATVSDTGLVTALTAGVGQNVTITVESIKDETKYDTWSFSITDEVAQSIVYNTSKAKTNYAKGDTWDNSETGVTAVLTYNSGRQQNLTGADLTYSGYNLTNPGPSPDVQTVTVSYNGIAATTTYNINVVTYTGLINPGQYKISHTRNNVKYYLKVSDKTSEAPSAVNDSSNATILNFALCGENEYTIKGIDADASKYLYSTASNDGIRFGSTSDSWIITGPTDKLTGSYTFMDKTNSRYLTLYNGSDFRGYISATASNRLENTDVISMADLTVSFNAGDGSGNMDPLTKKQDDTITLPASTFTAPANKEFDKWQITTGKSSSMQEYYSAGETFEMPGNNVVITATYRDTTVKHTLTWSSGTAGNNAQGMPNPLTTQISEGDKIVEPSAPTWDHHQFEGWFNNDTEWNFENDTVTCDVTLTAHWLTDQVTLSYDLNGGTSDPTIDSQTGDWGSTFNITNIVPTKSHATFQGWYIGETQYTNTIVLTENKTLVAKWSYNEDYKVVDFGSASSGWSSSYSAHVVTVNSVTVNFSAASKQTGTAEITNMPVVKTGEIVASAPKGKTFSNTTWTFQQWGSKAKTAQVWTSIDSGATYVPFVEPTKSIKKSGEVTPTGYNGFEIPEITLPSGTNTIKITFTDSSNQVGVKEAAFTLAEEPVTETELVSVSAGLNFSYTYDENNTCLGIKNNQISFRFSAEMSSEAMERYNTSNYSQFGFAIIDSNDLLEAGYYDMKTALTGEGLEGFKGIGGKVASKTSMPTSVNPTSGNVEFGVNMKLSLDDADKLAAEYYVVWFAVNTNGQIEITDPESGFELKDVIQEYIDSASSQADKNALEYLLNIVAGD